MCIPFGMMQAMSSIASNILFLRNKPKAAMLCKFRAPTLDENDLMVDALLTLSLSSVRIKT